MVMNRYRYTIITPTTEHVIIPSNSGRGKKFTLQNDGYYREELTGTILLNKDYIGIVQAYEQNNTKLYVKIEEFYNNTWQLYYKGYFFPWDCEFDLDDCTVSIKLKVDDDLSQLLENYNKKINVIDKLQETGVIDVYSVGNGDYEEEVQELNNYELTAGKILITNNVNPAVNYLYIDGSADEPRQFLYSPSGGSQMNGTLSIPSYDATTRYVIKSIQIIPNDLTAIDWQIHPVNSFLRYNNNSIFCKMIITRIRRTKYVVGNNVSPGTDYVYIGEITLQNTTIYKYAKYAGLVGIGNQIQYAYRRSNFLTNILVNTKTWDIQPNPTYLKVNSDTPHTIINRHGYLQGVMNKLYRTAINDNTKFVVSDLFFQINRAPVLPNNNIRQTNPLDGSDNEYAQWSWRFPDPALWYQSRELDNRALLLIQKSDFKYPTSTERATIAEVSLSDMLKDLCAMFNAGWYIDVNGNLRIEHVSYFENNLSYSDITTAGAIDISNEVGVRTNNKYQYDNNKIVDIVRITYSEASGLEFKGIDLTINTCTNTEGAKIKDQTITNLTTDVDYIINNISSVSNSGFVLVVADRGGYYPLSQPAPNWQVINVNCPLLNLNTTNGLLSASYLMNKFYRYGLPFVNAYINGILTTTTKVLRNKKQTTLQIRQCDGNISPYQIYKTKLGYVTINDCEHKIDEEILIINGTVL